MASVRASRATGSMRIRAGCHRLRCTSSRSGEGTCRADEDPAELPARADAELGENLAQMPLDGARAEEQLGADLRVRQPVAGEPGDLRLLGGERARRLHAPLADVLSGGQ